MGARYFALVMFAFLFRLRNSLASVETVSDAEVPVRFIYMIDASKSINRTYFYNDLLGMIEDSLDELPVGSEVGVLTFSDKVNEILPLRNYSKAELVSKVDELRQDESLCCVCCTPIAEAMEEATSIFNNATSQSTEKNVAVLMTDGVPRQIEDGSKYGEKEVTRADYLFDVVPVVAKRLEEVATLIYVNIPDNELSPAAERSSYFLGDFEFICEMPGHSCTDRGDQLRFCATRNRNTNCILVNESLFPIMSVEPIQFTEESNTNIANFMESICNLTTVCATPNPTFNPTSAPSPKPTANPTKEPTNSPTLGPTSSPTLTPTMNPSSVPSSVPSHTPTSIPTVAPTLECADDLDCYRLNGNTEGNSSIVWQCVDNKCQEQETTAATVVLSSVIVATVAAYSASTAVTTGASAGANAGSAGAGGGGGGGAAAASVSLFDFLGIAQYVAAGSMLNLPSGPSNYVNLATSLGFTTLIVIPIGDTNTTDDPSKRRLEELDDVFGDDAIKRYLSEWEIEPQYLFLSLSLSLSIIFTIALLVYVFMKYCKYWVGTALVDTDSEVSDLAEPDSEDPHTPKGSFRMKSPLVRRSSSAIIRKSLQRFGTSYASQGEEIELRLSKDRIWKNAAKRAIQISYYFSFPISLAIFYQLGLLTRVPLDASIRTTTVAFGAVVAIVLSFYLYWIYAYFKRTVKVDPPRETLKWRKAQKKLRGKMNRKLSKYYCFEYPSYVQSSPYYCLLSEWRFECRLFWLPRMLVNILRGAILGLLVTGQPRPVQAALFLVFGFGYMVLLAVFEPYKSKGQNLLAIFVASLYIPSTILLILFALDPAPFPDSMSQPLGTLMNVINFGILLGMAAVAMFGIISKCPCFNVKKVSDQEETERKSIALKRATSVNHIITDKSSSEEIKRAEFKRAASVNRIDTSPQKSSAQLQPT